MNTHFVNLEVLTVAVTIPHARELLSLSLLVAEFEDAIKEGNGERVQRCWEFFAGF